jgi:hypothetical protein
MPDFPFLHIDHVQLAMPRGEEERARRFFVEVLGMVEIPKPPELAKRGGCWFASGGVQIHLGVEDEDRRRRPTRLCVVPTTRICSLGLPKVALRSSKSATLRAYAAVTSTILLRIASN